MRGRLAWLLAMIVVACSSPGPATVTPLPPSPSPTAAVGVTASPDPTAPTSARPSPTPITELSQVFRPLAAGWRPTGTTLVIARYVDGGESTLVAVALGPGGRLGAPTPIVALAQGSWALRPDGGAIVIGVGPGTGRLAFWDVRSGQARWLTTAAAGGHSPVWSSDGSTVYYASTGDDGNPGIFQIGADGSGRKRLFTHERFGHLQGLTPDGGGLVWSRGQAGGSVDIFDIATGVNRQIENNAGVASWRARQPRLLLTVGGCCAGPGGGSLVAWDDRAMTSQVVAERGPSGNPAFGGASWDPTGTQVVAFKVDGASRDAMVVTIDPTTGATQALANAGGAAGWMMWLAEGIVLSTGRPGAQPSGFVLKLLSPSGGAAVSLYEDAGYIQRIDVVRP